MATTTSPNFVLFLIILSLTFGESVWLAGLQFLTLGNVGRFNLSSSQSGLYATAFFFGQVVSALFFGWLADIKGRRFSLSLSMSMALLGGLCTAMAPVSEESSIGWLPLLFCCLLTGLGVGGAIPVTQSLVVEYFPLTDRGMMACLASLGWPIGGVITSVSGWLLFPETISVAPSPSSSLFATPSSSTSTSKFAGWKMVCSTSTSVGASHWPILYMCLVCMNLIALVMICLYLPESPRFLKLQKLKQDEEDEEDATNNNANYNTSANENENENSIVITKARGFSFSSVANEEENTIHKIKGSSLIVSASLCKTFVLLGCIWFAVSFAGNGFMTFLPVFLAQRQLNDHHSIYAALIISNIIGIPGIIFSSVAVESIYLGRKKVMFLSTLLTSISFVVFLMAVSEWQIVFASCLQNFVVQSAWASVVTLTSEVPPTTHRARVVGGANMVKAISGILGPYFCGIFAVSDSNFAIFGFASIMFAASICALLLPNDTRGVDLVDIIQDGKDDDDVSLLNASLLENAL